MKKLPNPTQPHPGQSIRFKLGLKSGAESGFALIATISVMALAIMIAMAMVSLSTSVVRTSQHGKAMEEAQANARMALMMAIAELQRSTGNDTRVTAPADILESTAPPLTGVWRSWEGTNHDSTGRPIAPNYSVKTGSDSASGHFLTWLVSGAGSDQDPLASGNSPSELVFTSPTAGSIPLLSDGTLGTNPGQVHVIPQLVLDVNDDTTGAYAWWASPENQKARLLQPYNPRTNDAAGWADLAKSHAVPDPEIFGLESTLTDPEDFTADIDNVKSTRKAVTLDTTELLVNANPENPQQSFHDLSTSARGLLTNTATGGWRKDMSILTERWDYMYSRYPGGRLPMFRYAPVAGPTSTSLVPKPLRDSYDAAQSGFYPWSGFYQMGMNKYPSTYHTATSSWQSLANFATHYKGVTIDSSTNTVKAPFGWSRTIRQHRGNAMNNQAFYDYYHKFEVNPVIARIQLVVQANAIPHPGRAVSGSTPELYHMVNMRVVPYITMWNPYNVTISKTFKNGYNGRNNSHPRDSDFGIGSQRSLPITLGIINDSAPTAFKYKFLNGGNSDTIDGKLAGTGFRHFYDYQIPENIAKGYGNGSGYANRSQYIGIRSVTGWMPLEFDLKPGQVKIYAPGFTRDGTWSGGVRLKEGNAVGDDSGIAIHDTSAISGLDSRSYRFLHKVPGRGGSQLHIGDTLRFSLNADRYTKMYSDAITNKTGGGAYFSLGTAHWPRTPADVAVGGVPKGAGYIRQNMVVNTDMGWTEQYWPNNELDEVQYRVSELVPDVIEGPTGYATGTGNPPWTNIFSISFGPRLTFGGQSGETANRPTKGVLQSSPFASNTYSLPEQTNIYHPANGSYDMSYSSMALNGPLAPEIGTEGYIVSGFQNGDGLSRLIMAEMPLRPMSSLADLQSWNMRGGNPLPPYQYYIIGNSDATTLIEQDSVLPATLQAKGLGTVSDSENLQHDDAYCANHLLFDDWFFSSIAPQPTDFGMILDKNIDTVYGDYLQGTASLTNRAYRPIAEDRNLSASLATTRIGEILNSPAGDGWLKVASRFEVEGMFNVNSTSVKAWRALLGHARKQQIASYDEDGVIALDPTEQDHVVSRFSVAADVEAGTDSGAGANFPSGSEYAGFRTLSSDQLDDLAVQIVEQVKERGPFLSLSEFVNRQLVSGSTNKDLALTGALQAALNSLSDDPNDQLRNAGLSSDAMDHADPKVTPADYAFEEASIGKSTHGFPGWIRQADILRPIAPVLSARDDTFTIRAYGDARDKNGNVIARAWCEATVQRRRDFVDPADDADSIDPPTNAQNIQFGRRYEILKFRWVTNDGV